MVARKPLNGAEELELFALEDLPRSVRALAKRPPTQRDVLTEARELHGWTLDKLTVLELYLSQYRRVAGNGTYIDAFAGGGHFRLPGEPEQRPGSPLIAGRSGAFKHLYMIEVRESLARRLRKAIDDDPEMPPRTKLRTIVSAGDANVALPRLLASDRVDPDKACFCFLDPNSTQLDWTTVEALSRFKALGPGPKQCKVELWVLFNLHQAVQRLWPRRRPADGSNRFAATLDRVMGGRDAWIDLWQHGKTSTHLLHRYRDRLETVLGYTYVIPQVIQSLQESRGGSSRTDRSSLTRRSCERASEFRQPWGRLRLDP